MVIKADIKQIRTLHRKKGRIAHKQYIIEGHRILQEALQAREQLLQIYFTTAFQRERPHVVKDIMNTYPNAQIVSAAEIRSMSDTNTPSGVLGICRIPDDFELHNASGSNWLFLENISDPGNMGTLLRTASWFGITNISLSGDCVDIYNPKVVRSGMGAHFRIKVMLAGKISQFKSTHTIIGADQNGDSLEDHNITSPWVLVLGSEAHGISRPIREIIDYFIAIPGVGFGDSLNVAMAGGILMEKLMDNK